MFQRAFCLSLYGQIVGVYFWRVFGGEGFIKVVGGTRDFRGEGIYLSVRHLGGAGMEKRGNGRRNFQEVEQENQLF